MLQVTVCNGHRISATKLFGVEVSSDRGVPLYGWGESYTEDEGSPSLHEHAISHQYVFTPGMIVIEWSTD